MSANKRPPDTIDFGKTTAVAGIIMAAILIIVMFATSGQI